MKKIIMIADLNEAAIQLLPVSFSNEDMMDG